MTDKPKPGGYIWDQDLNEMQRLTQRSIEDVESIVYDQVPPEMRARKLGRIATALGKLLGLIHAVQEMTDD